MRYSFLTTVMLWLFSNLLCFAQPNEIKDPMAEKMLIYQLKNGGWPKQLKDKSVVNYDLEISKSLLTRIKSTTIESATIDNKATTREITTLIKAYKKTKNITYLQAAERGIDYLLEAQYSHGGFPQYYPNTSLYRSQITFNDDAMINALQILHDIATANNDFELVDRSYIPKAQSAVERGIAIILQLQVKQDSLLTIWSAQYDPESLLPAQARSFEPAALSTSESVGIVRFLMAQKNPSPAIITAIHAAIKWFEQHQIAGYRFDHEIDPKTKRSIRHLIADTSSTVWARFYDLESNKPIYGDRGNLITSNFEDLSEERKNGYAWFGNWPEKLLQKDYPKWLKRNNVVNPN
ncbi:pectate lyase [Sphingobacterium faecium]|uniref:pectate lyase n=1 Tax=Sphingobacterium faecium TaxID=34087 RepID=UPI00320B1A64